MYKENKKLIIKNKIFRTKIKKIKIFRTKNKKNKNLQNSPSKLKLRPSNRSDLQYLRCDQQLCY